MCSPMPLEAPVTTASGGLLSASASVILSMRSVLSVLPVTAGCALGSLIVGPSRGLDPARTHKACASTTADLPHAMTAAAGLGTNEPTGRPVDRSTTCRQRCTSQEGSAMSKDAIV